ncbi:toxic anion resistance protein [Bifidobacterium longum]|uniref:toxic anion resistance protein n=1 Tax=Bifidobacterium longum TaxID=216816 RepID=UPI0032DF58C0
MKLSKSKIIGLIALLAVVGVVCGTLVWRQSQPAPAEPTEQVSITGYLGGEKIGLFDDAKFKALAAKQGIAIDYRKAGSPAMMDTDRKGMGYLFPSSRAAVEYGNAKGVKAPPKRHRLQLTDCAIHAQGRGGRARERRTCDQGRFWRVPHVLDLAVNQTDAFKQIKDDVVIVYPTPTVWSTHTLMALDEKGDTLLNLLKTPAAQKLAWERHGFRAANFAGTDSISRFGVAGTLDQIPAVSELPNNDAMQHLITTLQSAQAKLVADISMYDTMYTQNAQQYRELKMTVLAGKKALADFNANQLPALEAEAAASGDAMQAQVLKDFKSKLDRFAKRLDDLDRISVVTLQTAPQIKIIQNADQTIVDKIDTTISTTIPVWKSQMVIALGLSNQRKVLDLQNKADDVTNKLLARNAAALHKGAVDAEKANQRSVVEIDTLEKINAELIATLKETVQIQKEGEANREAAQVKMRQIESDLKNALLENAQQM